MTLLIGMSMRLGPPHARQGVGAGWYRPSGLVDTHTVRVDDDPFRTVYEALDLFQARGIVQLNLSINDSLDALEITLAPYSPDGGVGLSVRGVHYFAMSRLPGEDISLVDFRLTTLWPAQPWPSSLPGQFVPAVTVPPLLWLHGDGAVTLDVVAAIVTVLAQVG